MRSTIKIVFTVLAVCSNFGILGAQTTEQRVVSLYKSGVVEFDRGNFAKALPLFTEAIPLSKQVLGSGQHDPLHLETAMLMKRQADCLMELMRLAEAGQIYQVCCRVGLKEQGNNSELNSTCIMQQGTIATRLHQFAKAEQLYKKVIQSSPTSVDKVIVHANLPYLFWEQNRVQDAEQEFGASSLGCKSLPDDATRQSLVANNQHGLGLLAIRQGRVDDADRLFSDALRARRRLLPANHRLIAHTQGMLSIVRSEQGQDPEAIALSNAALRSLRSFWGEGHIDIANELHDLALLLYRNAQIQEAISHLSESRRFFRNYVSSQLVSLAPDEQIKFMGEERSRLTDAMCVARLHLNDAAMVDAAWEWLLNDKGLVHEAFADQELMIRQETSQPQVVAQLKQLNEKLMIAASANSALTTAERDELSDLEVQLRRQLGIHRNRPSNDPWTSGDEVRKAILADTVLIDFVRLDRDEALRSQFSAKIENPQARYIAFVVKQDENPRLIDLGPAEAIDQQIAELHKSIGIVQANSQAISTDRRTTAALRSLYELTWKPIEQNIGDHSKVILSPDGPLWLLPWCALPTSSTSSNSNDQQFMIEKYDISLVMSGRDLLRTSRNQFRDEAYIFADPDFDIDQAAKKAQLEKLFRNRKIPISKSAPYSVDSRGRFGKVVQLPGTKAEANEVAPSMKKLLAGKEPVIYVQGDAIESVVKLVHSPRIVLFSTHGFFIPNDAASQNPSATRNPLLKCGLLFAGANYSQQPVSGDDGILTGLEVCGIDLGGTQLIVLSACETGIGEINSGDGVAGLRQAFQLAGADSVVSTLWKIPDEISSRLMNDFFDELATGSQKATALRNAQIKRIENLRKMTGIPHPFFWAAWTITGI